MWKRMLWLLGAIIMALLLATPVLADGSVDLGVTAKGIFTGGINNFTIVYVSDTQLDLSWTLGDNVTGIMIRGKYGGYPTDIASSNETPSDGYLVYYGSGNTTSDTSMDFDQNPGPIFYKAWAQRGDGTWVMFPSQGWKESNVMTLIAVILLCLGLTWVGAKSSFWILKALAGLSWIAMAMFWQSNPPSTVVAGTPVDTVIILLFWFLGIAMLFMPFWYTSGEEQGKGFRMRISRLLGREEEEPPPPPSRSERSTEYRDRVNGALRGRIRRKY